MTAAGETDACDNLSLVGPLGQLSLLDITYVIILRSTVFTSNFSRQRMPCCSWGDMHLCRKASGPKTFAEGILSEPKRQGSPNRFHINWIDFITSTPMTRSRSRCNHFWTTSNPIGVITQETPASRKPASHTLLNNDSMQLNRLHFIQAKAKAPTWMCVGLHIKTQKL